MLPSRFLVRIACALAIVATATFGMRTLAAGVTVVVDGRPLYLKPGPIERAGRVFVPLRGIFERLGASVVYQNRQINSTKGSTSVSLRIGSRQATVNGQPQIVDVAPFIVGATTYVPLRFIAQSLGAVVNYNGAARLVAITVPRARQPLPPPMAPNPPAVSVVQLRARQPAPETLTSNRFTPIAAQFSHEVDVDSVRVGLDGNDITSRSGVSPAGFSYKPPAPLDFGTHTVRVAGLDRAGLRFVHSWSFTTTRPAPSPESPVQLRNQQPSPDATVNNRFAEIAATFTPQPETLSVRVRLDGNDITGRSGVWAGGFSYKPPAPLEFGTHTVRVTGRGRGGLTFDRSWSFTVAPSPQNPVQLRNQRPSPDTTVENRFAEIAANFEPEAESASVRVRLDGNDITGRSGVTPGGFSYRPPAPLEFGSHTVNVTGRGRAGLAFDRSWSFTVRRPAPAPISLTIRLPEENESVGRTFDVAGTTAENARIRVTAGAPQTGTGQFSGTTTAGARGNFRISVTLSPARVGQQAVTVKITATDPSSSQTAEKTLRLRVKHAAPTPPPSVTPMPNPTPAPIRTPRVVPTIAPTPMPTVAPTPMPTPAPIRTPRVVPTVAPTPMPTPAPIRTPRVVPTIAPTPMPTVAPTPMPTPAPIRTPRVVPTVAPTPMPTVAPARPRRVAPSPSPSPTPNRSQ
ncbi:MAG TPA: stalk domain-containing protein [Candidatus Cybelea sp.]